MNSCIFTEGHRAVLLERLDPCRGRRGHHGAQNARRHRAAMLAPEILDRRRLGPRAEAVDVHDLALFREVDHERRNAGEVDAIGLQHAERDAGGDAGIDRIAAGLENLETGVRGGIVTGGDHVLRAGDRRTIGGHA
jgi:hypothetical protein